MSSVFVKCLGQVYSVTIHCLNTIHFRLLFLECNVKENLYHDDLQMVAIELKMWLVLSQKLKW